MDNQPYIIMSTEFDKSKLDDLRKCRVNVNKAIGQYSRLLHYCSADSYSIKRLFATPA